MKPTGLSPDGVLAKISEEEKLVPDKVLAFLSAPDATVRAERFSELAYAFSNAGDIARATALAKRAYTVSGYHAHYLDHYLKLLEQTGDIEGVREALKRAGVNLADEGLAIEALDHFNRSLYSFARHRGEDRYVYDFEMLQCIEAMAASYRFPRRLDAPGSRMRIAVLVFGTLHVGSVVVRILAALAEHLDRSRFDVAFFIPEAESAVRTFPDATSHIAQLGRNGTEVHVPSTDDPLEVMLDTASAIHGWKADLLITSALCADLRHYFITSTHPAPRVVALVLGPPPQFTVPWIDWNIAVSAHPGLDTPGGCSVTPLELPLPLRDDLRVDTREKHGLVPTTKVLVAAGRAGKFESRAYWKAIGEILSRHVEAIFLVIGVTELPRSAREELSSSLRQRVRAVPWREDYHGTLALADVVIDTYPSGGGVALLDAMALGIPVVSMANDYLHEFDQTDWALGNEFVVVPELIVPRGDFTQFVYIASRLLTDEATRHRLGKECQSLVRSTRTNPARMIRSWERVFEQVIARAPQERKTITPGAPAHRTGSVIRMLRWLRRRLSRYL